MSVNELLNKANKLFF